MSSKEIPYPRDTATAEGVLKLANAYRQSVEALRPNIPRGKTFSWSPYRLLVIHAIELYFDALLLTQGHSPSEIRKMKHDLTFRSKIASSKGLILQKGTQSHLAELQKRREYLTARYDTDDDPKSQINRLDATLADVAKKVTANVTGTKTTAGTSPARRSRA